MLAIPQSGSRVRLPERWDSLCKFGQESGVSAHLKSLGGTEVWEDNDDVVE